MDAFIEKQNFMKHWRVIMLPGLVIAIIIPVAAGFKGRTNIPEILISLAIILPIMRLLAFLTLHSRIDETGVTMKFSFQFKPRYIPWGEIKTVTLGKYDALYEYGGWGYKGWTRKKRAYNVSGDIGLKLTLQDGRSVLLGTQEQNKMRQYLLYIKDKYQIAALNELAIA